MTHNPIRVGCDPIRPTLTAAGLPAPSTPPGWWAAALTPTGVVPSPISISLPSIATSRWQEPTALLSLREESYAAVVPVGVASGGS